MIGLWIFLIIVSFLLGFMMGHLIEFDWRAFFSYKLQIEEMKMKKGDKHENN